MPALMPDGDDRIVAAPKLTARQKALIRATRYYHFRGRIQYSQARPTQLRLPRETTRLDCSGLVAACMDFAGVMPKIDWRFTNTWVQIKLGQPVPVAQAKPGDVVFYGPSATNPTHEALLLGTLRELARLITVPDDVEHQMAGSHRYVLSHGHYPMGIFPVDYRSDRTVARDLISTKARV